jgi:hypothetical protein
LQHHAAVARKIHLSLLFSFPEPPLITCDAAADTVYRDGLKTSANEVA